MLSLSDRSTMQSQSIAQFQIQKMRASAPVDSEDALAVEEPMEIRLGFTQDGKRVAKSISITMRTPGNDFDLAVGFLFTESIVTDPLQVASVRHCGRPVSPTKLQNVVRVELTPDVVIDFKRLERHFYTSSSCGVCGKTSLEALELGGNPSPLADALTVSPDTIHHLPATLRAAQEVFEQTGGLAWAPPSSILQDGSCACVKTWDGTTPSTNSSVLSFATAAPNYPRASSSSAGGQALSLCKKHSPLESP